MTISDLEKLLRSYPDKVNIVIRDRVTGQSFEIKEIHCNDNEEKEIVIVVS